MKVAKRVMVLAEKAVESPVARVSRALLITGSRVQVPDGSLKTPYRYSDLLRGRVGLNRRFRASVSGVCHAALLAGLVLAWNCVGFDSAGDVVNFLSRNLESNQARAAKVVEGENLAPHFQVFFPGNIHERPVRGEVHSQGFAACTDNVIRDNE